MSFFNNKNPSQVLGLTLDKGRVEGVVLRRSDGAVQIQKSFQATLSLDPLTNDPELVGREIRNHLNGAGIRVKACAVAVPLNWALTLQTKVPEIPEADVASFLTIEAEKGFPYAPEDLSISTSQFRSPSSEDYATIVAIPKNHLILLEKALRAAQLKPLSFSLGIVALQDLKAESNAGVLSLLVGESGIELEVTSGGGVAALRALEGAVEANGFEKHIDADLVGREIKITLGQLPKELRETVRKVKVFGRPEMAQKLTNELKSRLEGIGLEVVLGLAQQVGGVPLPADKNLTPALGLAARQVLAKPTGFEFLPPKVSAWSQASARFSSRKLVSSGVTAGALVLILGGSFLWQHSTLSALDAKWKTMGPKVSEIEGTQQQIRKFRPWFDESPRSLRIIRKITEAFPEDGSVSAKTLEIRDDLSMVICSGQAQDRQSVLKVLDRLRASKEIRDAKVDRMQGTPMVYSFSFRWIEGVVNEN